MNRSRIYTDLHNHRFELFFSSLVLILFSSLIVPSEFYEQTLSPILFLVNILSSLLLISGQKKLFWFFVSLFIFSLLIFGSNPLIKPDWAGGVKYIELVLYFIFYVTVTLQVIIQIWNAKEVNKNVIMGLMSGYISLGLVAFFIFLSIETATPGSFSGLLMNVSGIEAKIDSLIYYSYITLMTIGYGEIYPATPVAQKAAVLVGLMGQFYLVIITAVVVEKYLKHSSK